MARLTGDKHLHDKSPKHVFRVHHGLSPETGTPLRGSSEHQAAGCECAHCVAHTTGNVEVLNEAKAAFAKQQGQKPAEKTFTQAEVESLLAQQKAERTA